MVPYYWSILILILLLLGVFVFHRYVLKERFQGEEDEERKYLDPLTGWVVNYVNN